MTEAAETAIGKRLDARYTLLDKLGAGGQGEVWRAHDDVRGVDVALKVVKDTGREDAWRALEHEYTIANRLDHPGILKVFPPERAGDEIVLPMELAPGGDLRKLRGAGFLEIVPALLELANALEHAHARGVVHRDLKPGNVLFDARGRACLADFGVAETATTAGENRAGPAGTPNEVRDTNRHGFSPFTASPAQLRGEPPSPADDIYGLGALAYELLSGYPPYYPHFDKKRAIEERVPMLNPTRQIPPLLGTLVMHMLAKDASKRPRSMRAVIDELDAALNDTLTYDFENISPSTPNASVAMAAAHRAGVPDELLEQSYVWEPGAADRRSRADRRGRRSEDVAAAAQQPPAPESQIRPGHRSGAEALARIDAALERAAAEASARPKSTPPASPANPAPAAALSNTASLKAPKVAPVEAPPKLTSVEQVMPMPAESMPREVRVEPPPKPEVLPPPPKAASIEAFATPTPITPEQAAAIVAAARAAAKANEPPPSAPVSNDTVPGISRPAERLPPRTTRARWPLEGNPTIPGLPDDTAQSHNTTRASDPMSEETMVLPPLDMATYAAVFQEPEPTPARHVAPPAPAQPAPAQPDMPATARAAEAPRPRPEVPSPPHATAPASRSEALAAAPRPASPNPSVTTPMATAAVRADTTERCHSEHPLTVEEFLFASASPEVSRSLRSEPTIGVVPQSSKAAWVDIPVESLPKVARLEPQPPPRSWPWIVLGLLAGAVAVVFFLLPHFDTEAWPPEVAAVVEPLKAAVAPSSAPSSAPARATPSDATVQPDATALQSGDSGGPLTTQGVASARAAGVQPPAGSTSGTAVAAASGEAAGVAGSSSTMDDERRLRDMRSSFDTRMAALDARGAGVWGGRDFATARMRAAESVGARDAGNPRMAIERLTAAVKLLDAVEARAPQAYADQLANGDKALGAGQQEVAGQAFELAHRINPADRRAADGQKRTQNLNAVLPLLADAQNAEADHDYARAAQDFSQALSLDPGNAAAKAGQARTNAAFGDDSYAKAVGTGFAALGAGKLDAAHEAFVKARALKPNGPEAAEGLRRVGAALTARGFASMRQRALGLEAQERWAEAERTYEDVLAADPSLAFAQEGKARTSSRADLSSRLQQYLDRPDRLSAPGVRDDARSLLTTARAQSPQGQLIRSQIARLETLLPGFERPVHLSLVSDNTTQVAISTVGSFGSFSHRDIELRPGRYLVVGTRNGFRDVRREITVAPGQQAQTIRVTCSEPI